MGRWFSWNNCAKEQLGEFWVQKMILEDHLDTGPCPSAGRRLIDPDEAGIAFDDLEAAARAKTPQAQLAKLKAANGGLKLAYQLMTTQLYDHCKILYTVTKPMWNWYTDQVQNVKTPLAGLRELCRNANGEWMRDPQLHDLVGNALHATPSLAYMDVPRARSTMADRIVSVVWNLLAQRSWSLAVRHHGPPQCYVGLLSSQPLRRRRAMESIARDWKALTLLEERRWTLTPAKRLWDDMLCARIRPLRLLWCLCESHNYNCSACESAVSLLRGMLDVWPDNKIVEDCHNVVKADTLKTRSNKRCSDRQTDVMNHSNILESRGVRHTSRVAKRTWLSEGGPLHQRRAMALAPAQGKGSRVHYSQTHKMTKRWCDLMGKKVWGTCTETNHRRCVAAWHWYQIGRRSLTPPEGRPPKLADALLTRLLSGEMVVQWGDSLFASLGSYTWGALVYPLHIVDATADGLRTLGWGGQYSAVQFVHVLDATEWSVLSWTSALAPAQGIVLQEVAPPQSLLRFSLRERCASLTADLLKQIAVCLDIPSEADRGTLLRGIAEKEFRDCARREEIVADILKRDKSSHTKNAVATLLMDPLFEAAWDEMGQDDQFEFPDVKKEKTRGRVRRHVARHQELARESKRRRIGGRVGRGTPPTEGEMADGGDRPRAPAPGNMLAPAPENILAPAQENTLAPAAPDIALAPAQEDVERQVVEPPAAPHRVPREPRQIPWGRASDGSPLFLLAKTRTGLPGCAITVTCRLHVHGRARCNKSLSLGDCFTEEEAMWRIKAWCVAGLGIADGDGARLQHMDPRFFDPRRVRTDELRSLEELDALVNA